MSLKWNREFKTVSKFQINCVLGKSGYKFEFKNAYTEQIIVQIL